MTGVLRRAGDRFAHPRLAALFGLGLAVGLAGTVAWLLTPTTGGGRTTAARLLVLGYLLALAGGSGYLAFAAFEYRDRQLR